MNRYVLIRNYNPAYDYWLRAHLKEKRIMGDREYSWKEAQDIIMDMDSRGTNDDFFRRYFLTWANHPEYPPDQFGLLRMVLPIEKHDRLDLAAITQLDREARKRDRKILFSIEDAANDFYDYYDRHQIKQLARDLEKGAEGRVLSKYFEFEELRRIPDIRVFGREKVEEGVHDIATALLQELRTITVEKILDDVKLTLDQHYQRGLAAAGPQISYNYKSKYVQLSTFREHWSDKPSTLLTAARGRGALKEGYEEVYCPVYYVVGVAPQ